MLPSNAHKNTQGFTIVEALAVLVIVGVIAAISVPSFLSLFNKNKVDAAIEQVRGALQECQRGAIRRSKSCAITLDITNKKVTGELFTGERDLCDERDTSGNCIKSRVAIETNISGTPPKITFSFKGNTNNGGTIVVYSSDASTQKKKCLAISKDVGIMRTGTYNGSTAPGTGIDDNKCTAE